MSNGQSRFEEVSRRAFVRRMAAFGAAATVVAACGNDAAVFTQPESTAAASSTTTTAAATTSTTASATTQAPTTTTTAVPTPASGSLPAGAELLVRFTYDPTGTNARNPYVAVWVEDENGELVDTIALWFLQSQKGTRWIGDLRRWTSVDGSQTTIDTISSATRTPGDYSLVWQGTDFDGNPIAQGNYFIVIEAAREKGPYSLIREPIELGSADFSLPLTTEGELTNASVELVVG